MRSAKRLLSLAVIILLLIGTCTVPYVYSAEVEGDILFFNDFEGYTASINSGVGPDDNWIAISGSGKTRFGAYDTNDEGHNTVLAETDNGEASLYLGGKVVDGKIHIAFDVKMTSNQMQLLPLFYNGRASNDLSDINVANYGKAVYLNGLAPDTLSHFTTLTGWTQVESPLPYTSTEWHRFDIISTDMTGDKGTLLYYMDGQQVNSTAIGMTTFGGMLTLSFRTEALSDDTATADDMVFIDNVYVHKFSGEETLAAHIQGNKRIDTTDGSFTAVLTDRVDPATLTKDNITIRNKESGKSVVNYDIIPTSDRSFKVQFNGEITPGRYSLSLSDAIKGIMFPNMVSSVTEFSTDYKKDYVTLEYMNESFDDYTTVDGSLPDGFIDPDNGATTFATSMAGRTGEAEDYGFGFTGIEPSRNLRRFLHEYESYIPPNSAYTIEFDVYADNAAWYLFLPEEGDFNFQNSDAAYNSAISVDTGGTMYYSDSRSIFTTRQVAGIESIPGGQWHHISLDVKPDTASQKTVYEISVDGGETVSVDTTRAFYENLTAGIGFGYVVTTGDANLCFDNVMVICKNRLIYYPEADTVTLYGYDGNEISVEDNITPMVGCLVAEFNTLVEDDFDSLIEVTENGEPYPVRYELVHDLKKEKSTLTIYFDNVLTPLLKYTITIHEGIRSYYRSDITSFLSYNISFQTYKDEAFEIGDMSYSEQAKAASISIFKNSDREGKYIFAVCAYEKAEKQKDGVSVQVDELADIAYTIIDIGTEENGNLVYTVPFEAPAGSEIRCFLWEYPKLEKAYMD